MKRRSLSAQSASQAKISRFFAPVSTKEQEKEQDKTQHSGKSVRVAVKYEIAGSSGVSDSSRKSLSKSDKIVGGSALNVPEADIILDAEFAEPGVWARETGAQNIPDDEAPVRKVGAQTARKLMQFAFTDDDCEPCATIPAALREPDVELLAEKPRNFTTELEGSADLISLLDAKKLGLKLTPLEQQVVALKEEHPDLMLMVECGYKYRLFGEDAEAAGKILNMVTYVNHNFVCCTFPSHRYLIHVKRLVHHGCKIGIVKQEETAALKAVDPNSKRGIFRRGLEAIYTKSTFIDENDDASESNSQSGVPLCISFICEGLELADGRTQIGIISTFTQDSDIVYDHFADDRCRSELDARFTQLQPCEIVVPAVGLSNSTRNFVNQFSGYKSVSGDCVRVEVAAECSQDCIEDRRLLTQVYSQQTGVVEMIDSLPPVVQSCLAMAYSYLKSYQLERSFENIRNLRLYSDEDCHLQFDAGVVRNLDLVPLTDKRGPSTLFDVLNETSTKFGARLLRSWILRPLSKREKISERQQAVQWFLEHLDEDDVQQVRRILKKMPDVEKQLSAILHHRCRPKDFHSLCRSWSGLNNSLLQFQHHYQNQCDTYISSLVAAIDESLQCVDSFCGALDEAAAQENNKTCLFKKTEDYTQLHQTSLEIKNVQQELQMLRPSLSKTLGLMKVDYVTVSGEEYLIEVKNSFLGSVPSSWTKVSATKQCARFRSQQVQRLYLQLCCLREELKKAADAAWIQFLDLVCNCYVALKKANAHVATLDVLLALAIVAKRDNHVKPVFADDRLVRIDQGWHPVVSRFVANKNGEFVPNDTCLDGSNKRCMIVSGPNMGGKSCYMSQVAIIVIMAHMGAFVPAVQVQLPVFKSIFARMGLHDDIYAGRSTFMVEVMEASKILARASAQSLVIIDELGRGTGTYDGSALAFATLQYLVCHVQCMTIFVTHYPVVVQLEKSVPDHVSNYHMAYILDDADEAESDRVVFLYSMRIGSCPRSFGFNVARLAGIEAAVIERAKDKAAKTLSDQDLLHDFKKIFHL